jgi:lysophospholipase L1-like esterase
MLNTLRILLKFILIALLILSADEAVLQIGSYAFLKLKFSRENTGTVPDNSYRIMFIGDSWTEGADAKPGEGYTNMFIKMIKQNHKNVAINSFNYGRGCYNSSEASYKFLANYRTDKPNLLIILFGINNIWNAYDVMLANKLFKKELNFTEDENTGKRIRDKFAYYLFRSKVIKLCRIAYFNIFTGSRKINDGLPKTDYANKYFEVHAKGDLEKAREYLINNLKSDKDYADMYTIMLFNFGYDLNNVENYLKSKNMWKPKLIKKPFSSDERRQILDQKYVILEENIKYIKLLCDKNGIKIVLQTYPVFNDNLVLELNEELRLAAGKYGVPLIDQYKYFGSKMTPAQWKKVMTYSHVNAKGYSIMAENLYDYVTTNKLLRN